MLFTNSYEDTKRAEAYSKLEFTGTYYLAYRDLPEIIFSNVKGRKAIDFGCGTGRSTRFLQELGFDAIGVDIAKDMIDKAQSIDPTGEYCLIEEGNFDHLQKNSYDLILSVFTFDNIPTMEKKIKNLEGLRNLLKLDGKIVNLVSSPEIYTHEWVSFSTKDFPNNKDAKSGDKVKIIITDIDDKRPVEDVIWTDEAYRDVFDKTGLKVMKTCRPLANMNELYNWINETKIAPWVIYVLSIPTTTYEKESSS